MSNSSTKMKEAARIRKLWDSGRFKTRGKLAEHLGCDYQYVQKILAGRIYKQGTIDPPEGNHLPYNAFGLIFYIYDDGRVWSTESNKLVGFNHKSGYKQFGVKHPDTGKLINFRVSRIMLELFDRPPLAGEFARHLDDNPFNNYLWNLKWGTPQDNMDDCIRNGHRQYGEATNTNVLTDKIVHTIKKKYKGEPYKTFAKDFIARHSLEVGVLAVVRVLRGQTWTHITGFDRAARGTNAKLTEREVRLVHKNFHKCGEPPSVFVRVYLAHLKEKKGIVLDRGAIYNILRGASWPKIHAEFN